MFPSTISTFNIVNPTDRLNSPSHSALHNSISSVLTQVQTVIGVEGANSVVGSLEYLIKSPDSNGGGHIQTVNKGGTGQTTFTKGDLLVAQSQSVLSKLAVSSVNGYALVVDSNSPVGLSYQPTVSNKIFIKNSVVSYSNGASSITNVLFAASILGSTLGNSNAIRFTGTIDSFVTQNNNSATFYLQYGQSSVTSMTLQTNLSVPILSGLITGMIVGNGSDTDQKGFMNLQVSNGVNGNGGSAGGGTSSIWQVFTSGASSVNSGATQGLFINYKTGWNGGGTESVRGTTFIVEKIA
jgi:hypothetical protein